APLPDEDLTDGAASDAELDQVRNIRDIDAVARRGRSIDLDGDLGKRRKLIDIEHNVGGAGYILENPDDVLADPAHLIEIVAEDSHNELAVHVKNGIGDALNDGLADVEVIARQAPQARLHPFYQIKRRAARRPIALRMQ